MNEIFREAIDAAQRVVAGEDGLDQTYFEQLLDGSDQVQSGGDEERAYLAVLLDFIGFRTASARVLQNTAKSASTNATLQNLEGMLAAANGQYRQAGDLLKKALSAAGDSPSLRIKILANLAAVSLQSGSAEEALTWVTAYEAVGDARDPAADVLIASILASVAWDRGDVPGLRIAASSLREASTSRIAELGTQHPQALVTVANMAKIESLVARAEGSAAHLERAVSALEVITCRLAAEFGADHPDSLTALESLVLAELDLARIDGSAERIEHAIAALATASDRIESALGHTNPEALIMAENLTTARRELSLAKSSAANSEKTEGQFQLKRERSSTARERHGPKLSRGRRNRAYAISWTLRLISWPLPLVLAPLFISLYLVYLTIAIPVAAVFACSVYLLGMPIIFVISLVKVLISRPSGLSAPPRWPTPSASDDPAVLQYFYGPAIADAEHVIRIAYNNCRKLWDSGIKATGEWFTSGEIGCFTWPLSAGKIIGMVAGAAAGVLIAAAFAFVYLLVIEASTALVRMTGVVLRWADAAMLWIKNIRMVCPYCFESILYPAYACPGADCTFRHRDIRPGKYGIIQRRCRCGTRMNTMLLFGSSRMDAFCPHKGCDRLLEHRPGEMSEIVLPLFGAVGAGKTRLLSGIVAQLQSWAETGQLNVEFGDSSTAHELHLSRTLPRSSGSMASTSFELPPARVIRLISKNGTRVLHLYDTAGENFYSADRIQNLRYLSKAQTFILVIDPLSVEGFWRQLPDSVQAELSSVRSSAPFPEMTYQQAYQQFEVMGVHLNKVRLAVVFSRADLIRLPDGDVAEWAHHELGLGSLIRFANQNFKETRYFRTAAVMGEEGLMDESIAELVRWVMVREGVNLPERMP